MKFIGGTALLDDKGTVIVGVTDAVTAANAAAADARKAVSLYML